MSQILSSKKQGTYCLSYEVKNSFFQWDRKRIKECDNVVEELPSNNISFTAINILTGTFLVLDILPSREELKLTC